MSVCAYRVTHSRREFVVSVPACPGPEPDPVCLYRTVSRQRYCRIYIVAYVSGNCCCCWMWSVSDSSLLLIDRRRDDCSYPGSDWLQQRRIVASKMCTALCCSRCKRIWIILIILQPQTPAWCCEMIELIRADLHNVLLDRLRQFLRSR